MARMDDGAVTLIEFSADSNVKMYEKTVTPPGVSSGGAIDVTTMRNTTWRTKSPKTFKDMTDGSLTVAYDPAVYTEILAMIGDNQSIVITFPDATTLTFWGWIDAFTPGEMVEGEQPTAEVTIIPSNMNDSGVETDPVHA